MRLRTIAVSLCLALLPALGACADDQFSPSDPSQFDGRMFKDEELALYPKDQRAWIMGHAIGVYLFGKQVPSYVEKTGFIYTPGVSSPTADVAYAWHAVMASPSGGLDGKGAGVIYDDVPPPPPPPNCMNGDDVHGTNPCTPVPVVPTPIPPQQPPPVPPGGDGTCNHDDVGDPDCAGELDPSCETFLYPAALQARFVARSVDATKMLGSDFDGPNRAQYEQAFRDGMHAALHIQDFGEDVSSSEVEHLKHYAQDYGICDHSPLVLDLDGNGVAASTAAAGVPFDLLQTGRPVRTAWPSGDDALLALDRNGNGAIDDGGELFGDSLRANGTQYANGFASLATLDDNHDGVIDARDAAYAKLVLWRDANRDGKSAPGELVSLPAAGVLSIRLAYEISEARDAAGNALRQQGSFVRAGGGVGAVVDVWFQSTRL